MRSKLDEALGDIDALRKQLNIFEKNPAFKTTSTNFESNKEYEDLVLQLEIIHKKVLIHFFGIKGFFVLISN